MTLRGWHLDRQQFPPCLHLTVMPAHAASADEFLRDLAESVSLVKRPSLAKLRNSAIVSLAQAMVKLLPAAWVSRLTARAPALLSGKEAVPQRSAAMYGMLGTLPNRGDLHEVVLDLLDQLTTPRIENP